MNKVQKLVLAASVSFAMAFTACSNSNSDSGICGESIAIDMSGLPKQLYLAYDDEGTVEEYKGDGDILLFLKEGGMGGHGSFNRENNCPGGKIENGKIKLSFPKNIDGKYLDDVSPGFSLLLPDAMKLGVVIPDKGECFLELTSDNESYLEGAFFVYSTKSGYIDGLDILKGWNIAYSSKTLLSYDEDGEVSNNPDIIKGSLEWRAYCEAN